MRIIVVFIILILMAAGLYTAYGVLTFQPDPIAPLVFKEPSPADLQALGVLPKDAKDAVVLTPEQQTQTKKAVARIASAVTNYQKKSEGAPLRLKSTLDIINGAIASGKLPAYFLTVKDALHPARKYEMLNFDAAQTMEVPISPGSLACDDKTSVLLGNDGDDSLACASANTTGDQIFIGGPGNDKISDSFGNRIINPGSGDDTITLGPGRSIVVLDESWGHDSLTLDCKGSDIISGEAPNDFPVPWVSDFTNFIVLSPRISKNAVRWNGNVLTDSETGNTLSVSQRCFTLVNQ